MVCLLSKAIPTSVVCLGTRVHYKRKYTSDDSVDEHWVRVLFENSDAPQGNYPNIFSPF